MSSRFRRPPSGRSNLKQQDGTSARAMNGGGSGTARSLNGTRPESGLQHAQHSHMSPRIYASPCTGSCPIPRRPSSAALSRGRSQPSPIRSSRKSDVTSSSPRQFEPFASSNRRVASARSAVSGGSEDCLILCSDRSHINTREIMEQLRNKHADELQQKAAEETLLMSDYNAFSRPRPSTAIPLRSAFLDPETNNFYPSKTRSELMQRIKLASMPHPSYDIDGDGWVSQADYKLAKRFDFDGNGVIDPHERKIAKSVLTDEFFKTHRENLHVFGDEIANATHAENVNAVVNSKHFERTFNLLKGVEDSLKGSASKEMLGCMSTVHTNLTKHNYYTNKMDTTAWNDFDAVPRGAETQRDRQHHGSRRRLLESRKSQARAEGADAHQQATSKVKTILNHRIALISNFALEN